MKSGGRYIKNLRYADDNTVLAENSEDLKQILIQVKAERAKAGLQLNKKTKVMATEQLDNQIKNVFLICLMAKAKMDVLW